jgi:hypothetical protein
MPRGTVVEYGNTKHRPPGGHDAASRTWVAAALAGLKGYTHGGDYDPSKRYRGPLYFVPADTLSPDVASELKIHGEDDLFGGVVPYPFVATKTITHPLVTTDAAAPHGWSHDFSLRVQDAVLFGYSAYSNDDARLAIERVLERGFARIKAAHGIGGRGQLLIERAADVDAKLKQLAGGDLVKSGLVIEQHLEEAETYSIGRVRVADQEASYWGTQRVTQNNRGHTVYGGSDLMLVRGNYDALLEIELPAAARQAVLQARIYESAAFETFPGLYASRCNYDVARGRTGDGSWRSGVLEQSWRIGGASAAEVAALEQFGADSALEVVRASTFEVYGECEVPEDAQIQFQGNDERVGALTKYCIVERNGSATGAIADNGR